MPRRSRPGRRRAPALGLHDPAVGGHRHAGHRRPVGQREDIGRLQGLVVDVDELLGQLDPRDQPGDGRVNVDPVERQVAPLRAQTRRDRRRPSARRPAGPPPRSSWRLSLHTPSLPGSLTLGSHPVRAGSRAGPRVSPRAASRSSSGWAAAWIAATSSGPGVPGSSSVTSPLSGTPLSSAGGGAGGAGGGVCGAGGSVQNLVAAEPRWPVLWGCSCSGRSAISHRSASGASASSTWMSAIRLPSDWRRLIATSCARCRGP